MDASFGPGQRWLGQQDLTVGGWQRQPDAPCERGRDVAHVDEAERTSRRNAGTDQVERRTKIRHVGQVTVVAAFAGRQYGAAEAAAHLPTGLESNHERRGRKAAARV